MDIGVSSRLTFAGVATYDALALVDCYPDADERVEAAELMYAGGGPAATSAVVAARLGHDSAFIGVVGSDEEGEKILAGLRDEGVDVAGVRTLPDTRSAASVVVVSKAGSTRAICNRPLPIAEQLDQTALVDALQSSLWVHLDHAAWPSIMSVANRAARRARLSLDAGHPIPGFSCSGLDLYAPTVEALTLRYEDAPVEALLATAHAEGAEMVVATAGSAGAYGLDAAGDVCRLPSFPIAITSTLGAGDVFHGALVCGLAEGRLLADAILRANAVAALSCRALDGRSAIPTCSELEAFLASASGDPTTTDKDHQ